MATPSSGQLRLAMTSVRRLRFSRGLTEMTLLPRIRRIRWCRVKKSAWQNRRLARGIQNSDGLAACRFDFYKTAATGLEWGTLRRSVADVRLCRGPALFAPLRTCANGLQGDAAELETRAACRSDAARKMVGSLSGSAAQRAGREDQYFEPEPESRASSV